MSVWMRLFCFIGSWSFWILMFCFRYSFLRWCCWLIGNDFLRWKSFLMLVCYWLLVWSVRIFSVSIWMFLWGFFLIWWIMMLWSSIIVRLLWFCESMVFDMKLFWEVLVSFCFFVVGCKSWWLYLRRLLKLLLWSGVWM